MSFKETFEMIKEVAPKCSDNYAVLGSALLMLSERIGGATTKNAGVVDPKTTTYGPVEVKVFETPEEIKAFKDRMVEKVKTEMEKEEKIEENPEKVEEIEEKVEEPQISQTELRALMLKKVQSGKKKEVVDLLAGYGVVKLPELDESKYNELAEKVRAL